MDVSKEYIEMCEKARLDLNKLRGFEKIDDVYIKNGKAFMPYRGYEAKTPQTIPDGAVWLPRQDQLQEMMGIIPFDLEGQFHYWFTEEGCKVKWSWEQHWLAFVMKEKFNKQWNGEDWIEIK